MSFNLWRFLEPDWYLLFLGGSSLWISFLLCLSFQFTTIPGIKLTVSSKNPLIIRYKKYLLISGLIFSLLIVLLMVGLFKSLNVDEMSNFYGYIELFIYKASSLEIFITVFVFNICIDPIIYIASFFMVSQKLVSP
jgi:hypothetical protein